MWIREKSKKWIKETCGEGWLSMVDEVYDKLPSHLTVSQAYQKWGLLRLILTKKIWNLKPF